MIKKIDFIRNLAVFKDFAWDSSVTDGEGTPVCFSKVNLLYGRNYSGKTTLSRIVRALETGAISDKYGAPEFAVSFDDGSVVRPENLAAHSKPVRVFNDDFVRENLRCINNPEDCVTPFAVVVGEANNKIEREIRTLEGELGSGEPGKESGLYAKLVESSENLKTSTDEHRKAANALERQMAHKATDRQAGIKYRADKFGDINYTKAKLAEDIKTVLEATYQPLSPDRQRELERLLHETAKPPVPEAMLPELLLADLTSEAQALVATKIGDSGKIADLVRDVALNDWVKKGYGLHDGTRTVCGFCGGQISADRWAALKKHFDDESRALETAISGLLHRITRHKESIQSCSLADKTAFYARFGRSLDEIALDLASVRTNYVEQLDLIVSQLMRRAESVTGSLEFTKPNDRSAELADVFKRYDVIREEANGYTLKLNKEQRSARRLLLLHEIYVFTKEITYIEVCRRIQELLTSVDACTKARDAVQVDIQDKQAKIQAYKAQLSSEQRGAEKVNQYLGSHFGHGSLRLQAVQERDSDEKQMRFEIIRNGEKAYHLSQGECSLIAFCYFIARLDDSDTRGTRPIIWIDDPVSSLDGNHVFFIYSLLAAEVIEKKEYEQVFVSTHSLEFLKYLKRFGHEDKECEYFLVHRDGDSSRIQKMPKYMKEYVTEFNYLFHEIHKFARLDAGADADYATLCNFGNNARKFLEIYLYFRYPNTANFETKMKRFFADGQVPPILSRKMLNEYSHLGGALERASMPVEVPEARRVAKRILARMKAIDKNQYNALLNSLPRG